MKIRNAILASLIGLIPVLGFADGPLPDPGLGTFERVLLPVFVEGLQGQGGSVWSSSLHVRNEADAPVSVFSDYQSFYCHLPIECPNPGVQMPPHSSAQYPIQVPVPAMFVSLFVDPYDRYLASIGDDAAIFLYVDRAYSDFVHIDLLLRQTGVGARDAGTEIPVIREREMRTGPSELLAVPIGSGIRTTLRLYSGPLPDTTAPSVRIEIFQGDAESPSVDEARQLIDTTFTVLSDEYPDYLVIPDLAAAYPQLSQIAPLRIVITPLSPGTSYWGFASVADNVTQHVTLVTPH